MASPAQSHDTPVLIVGGGPVGLALAGDLGWRGVPCMLVERSDGTVFQPKMDVVGVRSMEFCRRWGLVEAVETAGYNREHPQDYAWVTALHDGYELGREPNPAPKDEPYPPQSPCRRERCPQNFFDPVLARWARSFPTVDIRHRHLLVDYAVDAGGVRAVVRDLASGEDHVVTARYLVGCDGGGSTVREQARIGMTGSPVLTYTTNAIFRSTDFARLNTKRPGYRYIFIGPEGTWCTIVAIDGRDHYRFSFVGDDRRRMLDEAEVRAMIVRAMGCPFDFEIVSIMPWVRRELVADRYDDGSGHVFICGDAAHLTSPTGGFGMNTGLQDAVDLSWKLAGVIDGWAAPGLLASYGVERRPVAVRNVSEATANLQRMLRPRDERPPPAIFEPGPMADRVRSAYGAEYTAIMKREWFTIGIHLGFVYEGSPAIVPDGTPRPPDEVSTYTPTARPGSRAPHVWLAPGRSTLDCFGRGFVLLRFDRAVSTAALEAAAELRKVPLAVIDLASAEARALYARKLVLVRPDGHVAWRSDLPPVDAENVIDIVRGARS